MNFDDLLKTLHQEYLHSMPEKIRQISEQIAKRDTFSVRESFHKLKGTGQTYGFPEVSELAALVEQICIQMPESSVDAAQRSLSVMQDIYNSRLHAGSYSFAIDPRVEAIRKLLPR